MMATNTGKMKSELQAKAEMTRGDGKLTKSMSIADLIKAMRWENYLSDSVYFYAAKADRF